MPRPTLRIPFVLLLALALPAAAAEPLSFDNPDDVIKMNRKVQCSTVDGEAVTYYWNGDAFSRIRGEPDKRLFRVEGMNVRACVSVDHPEYGRGYRMVSREIMLYTDPATGDVLSHWDNPWTGERVAVLHVANDPVNSRSPTFPNGPSGPLSFRGHLQGNHFWMNITVPLWYSNPLAGPFQAEVGGTYHATEMFNFFGRVDELTDPATNSIAATVGWARQSDWLPWMKMHGRQGLIYFHAAGVKLDSWDELPDVLKNEIAAHYPEYTDPPPLDDARPNVTSWTYYLDIAEGRVQAPERD